MIEQDTIRLLRECDSGARMGVTSIDDVLRYTKDEKLTHLLEESRSDHVALSRELSGLLDRYGDEGKEPGVMASSMAHMKTVMELTVDQTDSRVADLMVDGCNMGVKSLSKYLNQYAAADEKSKEMAKRLIGIEERLAVKLRDYL